MRNKKLGVPSWLKYATPELRKQAALASERNRRAKAGLYVLEYLRTHPCVDCGETDPVVLDFDHIKPKRRHVTYMVSHQWGLEAIAEEIAKCVVRCANCHRKKTAREQNWSRLRNYNPLGDKEDKSGRN